MRNKIMIIVSTLGLCIALLFIGISEYHDYTSTNVTILVKLKKEEDPFKALKSIVPNDSGIVDVTAVNRTSNEYKITVKTRRKKEGLLDFIRGNKSIEKAEDLPKK